MEHRLGARVQVEGEHRAVLTLAATAARRAVQRAFHINQAGFRGRGVRVEGIQHRLRACVRIEREHCAAANTAATTGGCAI